MIRYTTLYNGITLFELTYKRYCVSSNRKQVVHDEQKNSIAQDEGHFERRSVNGLRGQ